MRQFFVCIPKGTTFFQRDDMGEFMEKQTVVDYKRAKFNDPPVDGFYLWGSPYNRVTDRKYVKVEDAKKFHAALNT